MEVDKYESNRKASPWTVDSTKLLLSFLTERQAEVRQLRTNHGILKEKLWKDASDILINNGYQYSPKQCSTKWKNIIQNHRNGKKGLYEDEVEKILGNDQMVKAEEFFSGFSGYYDFGTGDIKGMDDDEEADSSLLNVANQPHLESILKSFYNAGFDSSIITPWVSSLSKEVLGESSDEQIMWKWIEWKSDDADTDMVIGTEGINEDGSDVTHLMKWGFSENGAKFLRSQFSFEAWCEYDLYSQMIWWIEERRNFIQATDSLYPRDNPPVDEWIGVGENMISNTYTYYVSQNSRETLNDNSANIINGLCALTRNSNYDLKLFHATKWQYVQQILNGIEVGYRYRPTDFSSTRAFYTTTEFHTALRHCKYHTEDWRGCAAIIIFLLPRMDVMNPKHYIYLEENWEEVVKSDVLKGKWFVQGKQLCNVRNVIYTYKNHGIDSAKKIAVSHTPPRDQLAVIRDEGSDILDSAIKSVIILPKEN